MRYILLQKNTTFNNSHFIDLKKKKKKEKSHFINEKTDCDVGSRQACL